MNRLELDQLNEEHDRRLQDPDDPGTDLPSLRARMRDAYATFAAAGDEIAGFMHQYLASGVLDQPADPAYRFRAKSYLTLRANLGYPSRGRQALDEGVALGEQALADEAQLPEAVRAGLHDDRNTLIMQIAAMRLLRYQRVYEQLLTELPDREADLILADVQTAAEALTTLPPPWSDQPHTTMLLAQALMMGASLVRDQESVDQAIALARQAVAEARASRDPELTSFEMQFADVLIASERASHAAEATDVLEKLQHVLPPGSWLGRSLLVKLAAARSRAWMLDRNETSVPAVRQAYLDAVAATIETLPFLAVQTLTQWGGWARMRGSPDETALVYAAALRLLPGLLAGEESREQKAQILRSLPEVAATAAIGLARGGRGDDAARAFEDGRAALFADALRARD